MKNSLFDLSGRVALVTGGSKGLGKAMARAFAEAGADVVISSRHEDELKAALDEIRAGTEVRGKYVVADMTRRSECDRLAKAALAEFGRVDVLVNNAGSNVPEECDKITDANWDRIVELNLSSCMALTRALVPQMKSRKWGRVIHISSIMGLASKAGRDSLLGHEVGAHRSGPRECAGTGPVRDHGQLPRPRPLFDGSPRQTLSAEEKAVFASALRSAGGAIPKNSPARLCS